MEVGDDNKDTKTLNAQRPSLSIQTVQSLSTLPPQHITMLHRQIILSKSSLNHFIILCHLVASHAMHHPFSR
jgi:hypothetical protein